MVKFFAGMLDGCGMAFATKSTKYHTIRDRVPHIRIDAQAVGGFTLCSAIRDYLGRDGGL